MRIELTALELEKLIEVFGQKKVKIEFLDTDKIKVSVSLISITLFIHEVLPLRLTLFYQMNGLVHFIGSRLINLDREGIEWNKKEKSITVYPFSLGPPNPALETFYLKSLNSSSEKLSMLLGVRE